MRMGIVYWRCQVCGRLVKRGQGGDGKMFVHRGRLNCIACLPTRELDTLGEQAYIMRLKARDIRANSPKLKIILTG